MRIFLLPHHPLDPRYRYCLEREHRPRRRRRRTDGRPGHLLARAWDSIQAVLVFAKREYDYLVHGHEQIRLSRLVVSMDEDEELTIIVPKGMGQDWALEAVRGVIRSGLMKHRAHVGRNLLTALFIQLILFIIVPTHVAGLLFLPLIVLYGFRRYREDVLIRSRMEHLLNERLARGPHRLQEHDVLAAIEQVFQRVPEPAQAYQEAIRYLNHEYNRATDVRQAELRAIAHYYKDIGRWDPYERFQDRALRSVVRALKRARDEIVRFWKAAWFGLLRLFGQAPAPAAPPPEPEQEDSVFKEVADDSVLSEPEERSRSSEQTTNSLAGH